MTVMMIHHFLILITLRMCKTLFNSRMHFVPYPVCREGSYRGMQATIRVAAVSSQELLRGNSLVEIQSHKLKVAGSIPAPRIQTTFG